MPYKYYAVICSCGECLGQKSDEIYEAFMKEIDEQGLEGNVQILKGECESVSEKGPLVKVEPGRLLYHGLSPKDIPGIVREHFKNDKPVEKFLYKAEEKENVRLPGVKFYQSQYRIVLRNCGIIDPEKIEDYIQREGYAALSKVIFEMSPDEVIEDMKESGLRGRGGAGFPTWMKWKFTREAEGSPKYIICNADEGDPGAYMDRSTLEGDPHSILEAMAIAGYTIGSSQGYIYIRAEYPLAIKRLNIAIAQAKEAGLLGDNIFGSDFSFNIELRLGAGAFVCGEETALIASIEGDRGMPRPRPPFPSVKGLWGVPSCINNVETLANIPVILLKGGKWFSSIGTETSKGTKVFALTGKVNNSGLVEIPMGTTLRKVIYNIGGGVPEGKEFKAAQTGGPSGGMIPADYLDTPIDYENLSKLGSIMGSGGLIAMDEDDCMIDVSKFYLQFSVDESCGKCAPCRIGGQQLLTYLEKISSGKGTSQDVERLNKISETMRLASLCGLGQSTPNPVLSSLKYFVDEYNEHIEKKYCRAKKCRALVQYKIISDKCIGCGLCKVRCPVDAVTGEKRQPHDILQDKCIKCGECYKACKFDAIALG